MNQRVYLCAVFAAIMTAVPGYCRQAPTGNQKPQNSPKHILEIIPNNRSAPSLQTGRPLTPGGKFKLAFDDAFDPGNFVLAAFLGGESQLADSNPSFGSGIKGFARYYGTSFADLAIGDFMTEAVFPSALHQDPRYFRRGAGSGWSRLAYAVGQIFFTHGDSGTTQLNFSELAGNSAAVAVSQAYYPDGRTASDAALKLATQLGIDMAGNVLKEFWPDLLQKLSRKNNRPGRP